MTFSENAMDFVHNSRTSRVLDQLSDGPGDTAISQSHAEFFHDFLSDPRQSSGNS
jgi:hypothetical protein